MIQKLKMFVLSFYSLFLLAAPVTVGGIVSAAPTPTQTDINNSLCNGSNLDFSNTSGTASKGNSVSSCNDNSGKTANDLVATIINIISLIVGAVAVIMLIVGGFRYVTSGGKTETVGNAKNTILYALIGLVIVALAQIVVHFVLNNLNATTGKT